MLMQFPKRLDLFGIIVLAFVAGNFGGITRDVLLGAVPPNSIADWRYVVVSIAAGILTFRFFGQVQKLRSPVQIFDAAGLAMFAVACPVCNKIVLLALGTSGALGFWQPLQPWLAGISLLMLGAAVVWAWRRNPCADGSCADGSCAVRAD